MPPRVAHARTPSRLPSPHRTVRARSCPGAGRGCTLEERRHRETRLTDDKPRLGPWLRHAARQDRPAGEGIREYAVAGAIAVAALAVSAVVLLAFVRFPVPTLGVLVAVWLVGYILYLSRKRRTDLEDQLRRLDLERRDGERQRDRR